MTSTVALDFVLLEFHPIHGTSLLSSMRTRHGVTVAALAELRAAGSVSIDDGKAGLVRVESSAATGHESLDRLLRQLGDHEPMTPGRIAVDYGTEVLAGTIAEATADGTLTQVEGKVLDLFPHWTWPAASTDRRDAVRADITAVLHGAKEPDDRTRDLIAILTATKSLKKVLAVHGEEWDEMKPVAKSMAKNSWAANAIKVAHRDLDKDTGYSMGAQAAQGNLLNQQ